MATASGRLLSTLFATGTTSRVAATTFSGLAPSAAGSAVAELEGLGLIRSTSRPPGSRGRGRPSPEISIVPDGAVAISIDLSASGYEILGIDLTRRVKWRHGFEVLHPSEPELVLDAIARDVSTVVAEHGETRVAGVGLSVPGIVAGETGVAKAVLALGWHDIGVGTLLEKALGGTLPVAVEHDATLGALAESRSIAHDTTERILYLSAQPRGLGAALITTSPSFAPPDIHGLQAGHLTIDPRGERCSCGSRGCLEMFIDGASIRHELGLTHQATLADIADRLAHADMQRLLASGVVHALEIGLVASVNLLVPDRVVLAGALGPIAEVLADRLEHVLESSVVAQAQSVLVQPGAVPDAVPLGAAERAFTALFSDPTAFAAEHDWGLVKPGV